MAVATSEKDVFKFDGNTSRTQIAVMVSGGMENIWAMFQKIDNRMRTVELVRILRNR